MLNSTLLQKYKRQSVRPIAIEWCDPPSELVTVYRRPVWVARGNKVGPGHGGERLQHQVGAHVPREAEEESRLRRERRLPVTDV